MFGLSSGSAIIDFCIGMMFFFLIMTLTCTMINEYLMDKFGRVRQRTLLEGIAGLFYDFQKLEDFYKHPLITGLYDDDQRKGLLQRLLSFLPDRFHQKLSSLAEGIKKGLSNYWKAKPPLNGEPTIRDCVNHLKENVKTIKKFPSYISSRTFTNALLDIVVKEAMKESEDNSTAPGASVSGATGATGATIANGPFANPAELKKAVGSIKNERIKGVLLPLIETAPDLEKAKQNIEKWFDDSMDRVSGWFKRQARRRLMWVAVAVCLVINADSIMVGKMLWQNDALRAAVVAQADKYADKLAKSGDVKETPQPDEEAIKKAIKGQIDELKIPLGWVWPSKEIKTKESEKPKDPRLVPIVFSSKKDFPWVGWNLVPMDGVDSSTPSCSPLILKLLGLFFTVLAISFGAPFWTDLLNRFVNLRRNGNVPSKVEEEKK